MKNIYSFTEFVNESIVKEADLLNYMVFGNLQTIRENVDFLLSLDPVEMDETITNGHDWAQDHISVANQNLDQVVHFFKTTNESSSMSPAEKARAERESEDRLKEKISSLIAKMKKDPGNYELLKLEVELTKTKLQALNLQRRIKEMKN